MATIRPFCGLRPVPELAQQVVSLPYDVMNSDEARQITANNPYSFLRVTKAEVDLEPDVDIYSDKVYEKAGENLREFIEKGILVQDQKPCFYVYKQQMGTHIQVGLVATASVEEYQQNIIKKHELTRPDKEQDRIKNIIGTEAQTGAIFLTYRGNDHINALIAQCMNKPPVYDFVTSDENRHSLYIVDEAARIRGIEQAFERIETLYIADGHHRLAAASHVYNINKKNPEHIGDEAYTRFLTVLVPHNMTKILDYNRVVQDLNGLSEAEFLAKVQEKFNIEPCTRLSCKAEYPHYFGMYLNKAWYKLVAKPGTYDETSPVGKLDVSILQENLLKPVLGIINLRTDNRINFVGGIRGIKELERLVDNGEYAVAFSMFPTSIKELMAIADIGEIMPPKSTWFEPKLRDAMVVHMINGGN
ncbi:DUF1015 domain-containing protein [Pelosinus sp. sgz500959]|uniref:DUF1015 domain-containing protein n=1 Tax=Pelosinus sp. sgz500959 TaxID=3242472 RepID=UPI00366A7626